MDTPKKFGSPLESVPKPVPVRKFRPATIKIQSAISYDIHVADDNVTDNRDSQTVGQLVDFFLIDESKNGRVPTKLVLDLNPPVEPHPGSLE